MFEHPDNSKWLIKVYHNTESEKKKSVFHSYRKRYNFQAGLLREFREYIASKSENECPLDRHIPKIIGLADTDIGLGLIVERLQDNEGNLAVTLWQLMKQGSFKPEMLNKLDLFFQSVRKSDIVVGDLNVENIVWAFNRQTGYNFFLVDGLGDKTFIPMKRWFGTLNNKYKSKRIKKIRNRVLAQAGK